MAVSASNEALWIAMATGTTLAGSWLIFRYLVRREMIRIERREQNLCAICGYDLRATPERCPECGASASSDLKLPLDFSPDWRALREPCPESAVKPRIPGAQERPVILCNTISPLAMKLLVEHLNAAGVVARLESFRTSVLPGSKEVVYWRLLVWSGDVERAVVVAKRFRQS